MFLGSLSMSKVFSPTLRVLLKEIFYTGLDVNQKNWFLENACMFVASSSVWTTKPKKTLTDNGFYVKIKDLEIIMKNYENQPLFFFKEAHRKTVCSL